MSRSTRRASTGRATPGCSGSRVEAAKTSCPIDFATAYIPAEMYPSLYSSALPFAYEWRYDVDPERLHADQVVHLRDGLRQIGLTEGLPASGVAGTVAVRTGLPGILDQYAAEIVLTETVLSVAAIGPLGMAGGAMAMAAILLGVRRRASFTLVRGRGATGWLGNGALGGGPAGRWRLARRAAARDLGDPCRLEPHVGGPRDHGWGSGHTAPGRRLVVDRTAPARAPGARRTARSSGVAAPPCCRGGDRPRRGRCDGTRSTARPDCRPDRHRGAHRSAAGVGAGVVRAGRRRRRAARLPGPAPRARLGRWRVGSTSSQCLDCDERAAAGCRQPAAPGPHAHGRLRGILRGDRVEPRPCPGRRLVPRGGRRRPDRGDRPRVTSGAGRSRHDPRSRGRRRRDRGHLGWVLQHGRPAGVHPARGHRSGGVRGRHHGHPG